VLTLTTKSVLSIKLRVVSKRLQVIVYEAIHVKSFLLLSSKDVKVITVSETLCALYVETL
jgi:hypothetical protein